MDGVQDFGIIINAEGSNHLTLVFLILFFIFNLSKQKKNQRGIIYWIDNLKNKIQQNKSWGARVWHTYITGDVCVSTGGKDRNSVALDFKLFGFGFLPVVLVTVLSKTIQIIIMNYFEWCKTRLGMEGTLQNKQQPLKISIETNYNEHRKDWVKFTHVTEVKSVHSGLYEERIVWRQVRLELSFLILGFIFQLWKRKKRHKIKLHPKKFHSLNTIYSLRVYKVQGPFVVCDHWGAAL